MINPFREPLPDLSILEDEQRYSLVENHVRFCPECRPEMDVINAQSERVVRAIFGE